MRAEYNLKTLGPRAAQLVVELNERQQTRFTPRDAEEITGLSPVSTRSLLSRIQARGLATRLKPGLYQLVPFELGKATEYVPSPVLIARDLLGDEDYFISYGSAFELHRMVTQPQFVTFVSTTRKMRPLTIKGHEFRFVHTPRRLIGLGVTKIWITSGEAVRVSDPERTIIDGLHRPEYVGGVSEVAKGLWMKRDAIVIERLIDYALALDVGAVFRRLGYLLEFYDLATAAELDRLQAKLTSTYQRLDPLFADEGRMTARWRLRLNVEPEELDAVRRT